MKQVTVTLYEYAELSPEAQEKARDWWREVSVGEEFYADLVVDDFLEVGQALGFTFYTSTQSDEYIEDAIIANEYEFTVDGRRAS